MSDPILKIKNVSYGTEDNPSILKDISLEIPQAEYLTITGPSGSGKSTLLKIISSLISNTSGSIIYNNKSQYSYEPTEFRKQVSYCFQSPRLFGETVEDNLSFPFEIRNVAFNRDRAVKALEFVGLDESFLTKKNSTLSGGQTQRVALLRNIMFVPKVILLDEVSTGLDEITKGYVSKLINHLNQDLDVTVLSITHDKQELDAAKSLITIANGQIVHSEKGV